MMADTRTVSGKKVVIVFAGSMAALAILGLVIVLWVLAQPVVQSDQRSIARLLSNAYQKYRYDVGSWPTDAYDAAVNFNSETPDLAKRVRKAEAEWGLRSELKDANTDSPTVTFIFTKPSPLELKFSLYNRERKRR